MHVKINFGAGNNMGLANYQSGWEGNRHYGLRVLQEPYNDITLFLSV